MYGRFNFGYDPNCNSIGFSSNQCHQTTYNNCPGTFFYQQPCHPQPPVIIHHDHHDHHHGHFGHHGHGHHGHWK